MNLRLLDWIESNKASESLIIDSSGNKFIVIIFALNSQLRWYIILRLYSHLNEIWCTEDLFRCYLIDSNLLITSYPYSVALILTCNHSDCMIPICHETDIAFDDPIDHHTIDTVNIIVQAFWLITKRSEYLEFNSLKLDSWMQMIEIATRF